jgi:septum formation protein
VGDSIRFYLASASPRRRELLAGVGLLFDVISVDLDESSEPGENPAGFVARMAHDKACLAGELVHEGGGRELPILAADTCVTIDGLILGKPDDMSQAKEMLYELSGNIHQVLTAVALKSGDAIWQKLSRSRVTFEVLSPQDIDAYCASGEPSDKAGAYAIQGLGAAFVKRMEGSYTGVVGLPMYETRCLLKKIGIDWL